MRRLTSFLACLLASSVAIAQPGQPPQQTGGAPFAGHAADAPATTIETYNISDLARVSTDYRMGEFSAQSLPMPGSPMDASNPFGAGGGGFSAVPDGANTGPRIIQLIQNLIEPTSWMNNGGTTGQIEAMGNLLIIRQTPATHAQVQELIRQLRSSAAPSRVLKISADWIEVAGDRDPSTLAADAGALEEALKKPYARARTTCFNGQTVYVTSGREQTYVRRAQPIVGTNAAGVELVPDTARSGVMLQVSPQLVPDSETVVLDLTSIVRQTESIEPAAPATQPAINFSQGRIDRIKQLNQQLQTTLRTNLNQRTVVGGMTFDPSGENPKQLLLVVKVELAE